MAIRITGLNSGLDTESIISALVSSYSYKKQKYEKAQTKLSWTQDAWKSLNTKIYSLYSNISNLRYTSAYTTKTATISDSTRASVTASSKAVNGTYTLEVKQVAKSGYLTGANLGSDVTSSTKLSELGFTEDSGKITVTAGGTSTDIEVTSDMTVGSFVSALSNAGVNASYDSTNHRIFVSAQSTGAANDFSLTSADGNGLAVLNAVGLNTASSANTEAYEALAAYAKGTLADGTVVDYYEKDDDGNLIKNDDGTYKVRDGATYSAEETQNAVQEIRDTMTSYASQNTELTSAISYANAYRNYSDVKAAFTANGGTEDEWDTLGNLLSLSNASSVYVDADGSTYDADKITTNDDGTYTYTYTDENGDEQTKEFAADELTIGSTRLAELEVTAGLATVTEDEEGNKSYTVNGTAVSAFKSSISTKASYEAESGNSDYIAAVEDAYANSTDDDDKIAALTSGWQSTIDSNKAYISEYSLLGNDTDTAATLTAKIGSAIEGLANTSYSEGATRVNGQDAVIVVNGATFTSEKNTFEINGLTISAQAVTDGEVSITVDNDVQGLYDKIKDFLTQYNSLINEMTSLYNADSAKGYEPLTDDEKDEMSDTEIEKWEEKIKSALLRRDDTLESIMNSMTSAMYKSYTVNGKSYSLSSFGISTLGYLNAAENEQYAYHIDGDEDDSATSGNTDKLMAALQSDPDTVVDFMKQLTSGLYSAIDKKMKSTTLSSAYTVYNDKEMASEYSDYTDLITKWEEKLEDKEDYYYDKFSSMETALAKLNSQSSSLSGLLG